MWQTPEEYTQSIKRIDELRSLLASLRSLSDAGRASEVGATAAQARIELRQVGQRVAQSLAGDERIDSEQRLLATVRVLDDVDVASLRIADADAVLPPGFSELSVLLDRAIARLDDFRKLLPLEPDPFAS